MANANPTCIQRRPDIVKCIQYSGCVSPPKSRRLIFSANTSMDSSTKAPTLTATAAQSHAPWVSASSRGAVQSGSNAAFIVCIACSR